MNRRSSAEMIWGEYFLGVYPLSLQFSRDYNTKFQLYFEKNLQIISRYETPISAIRKQEPVIFNTPGQIQHFKIQSDKNLDFQWSLYIKREDIIGNNQEFVEGQKVSLTDMLNAHQQTGQNSFECSINFNRMKCKFSYLFCISSNPKELLNNIQKYTNEHKPSVLTSDSRIVAPSASEISGLKEDTKVQKNSSFNHGDQNSEFQVKIESSKVRDEPSYKFQNTKEQRKKEEIISEEWSPEKKARGDNRFVSELSPAEEPKLSTSDIQIGNEIQEKIMNSQKEAKRLSVVTSSQLSASNEENKGIKLTSSQLLNDRGEVIVPFYRKKFFYLIMAVIVLFLASRMFKGNNPAKKEKVDKLKETKKPKGSRGQKSKEAPKSKKRKG